MAYSNRKRFSSNRPFRNLHIKLYPDWNKLYYKRFIIPSSFQLSNNTVNNLPAQAVSEVVITCPNEALTLNVVGYNKAAIAGARIDLVEITNGLFYTTTTDSSGSATSEVTFGMYRLQIYKDNILINETNIEAFSAQPTTNNLHTLRHSSISISC